LFLDGERKFGSGSQENGGMFRLLMVTHKSFLTRVGGNQGISAGRIHFPVVGRFLG